MKSFRPIFFCPGASILRLPIAALVEHDGKTTVVVAGRLPGADYLGGKPTEWVMQAELDKIRKATSAAEVYATTGPYIEVGGRTVLADMITDPVAWVQQHVLPA